MNKKELIEKYDALRKEHNLPSWEEVDKEFFLSFAIAAWNDIPENTPIYVLNRMMDYCNSWINYCHLLINGSPQSMIFMREAEFFNDEEKRELISVMTSFTLLSRKQTLINLYDNSTKTAAFIKEVYDTWKELKPVILKFAEKSYAKWTEEAVVKKK